MGVLGGQQLKSIGKLSDWHQLWFTSADSSGNGHRLDTSRPSIPQGAFGGGGGRVSQIQKSGEAVTRLNRLAPHLAHICRSIWEWIHAKQIAPRDTRGTLGGLGVKHSKVWGSCQTAGPIGTNFGSCLRIHLGMDISQVAPQYPRGHWGGGGSGSPIQKSGKAVNRLHRLAPNLVHVSGFVWEWTKAKYNSPHNTPSAFPGFLGGHKFKCLGMLSNGWTDWHQLWFTSADSSGNGHS